MTWRRSCTELITVLSRPRPTLTTASLVRPSASRATPMTNKMLLKNVNRLARIVLPIGNSVNTAIRSVGCSYGVALVPLPESGWRVDLVKGRWRSAREPILEGCGCPACVEGFSRGYLHYLLRAGELTGARLLTMHNLTFMRDLMAGIRTAIAAGRFEEYEREVLSTSRAGARTG